MAVAVDTNVLIALAGEDEEAAESLSVLRERLPDHRCLVSPTVLIEIGFLSRQKDDLRLRHAAAQVIRRFNTRWGLEAGYLAPVQLGIAEQAAREILWQGLLPPAEKHNAFIVAEAALLNAALLVTGDSLLRGVERLPLELLLSHFHLHAPVIVTPRDIIRQFRRS
jgi:predicted nucleic acid-binding protein